jgi:hypothetical protein
VLAGPPTGNSCGLGLITGGGTTFSLIMLSMAVAGRFGRTTFGMAAEEHKARTYKTNTLHKTADKTHIRQNVKCVKWF